MKNKVRYKAVGCCSHRFVQGKYRSSLVVIILKSLAKHLREDNRRNRVDRNMHTLRLLEKRIHSPATFIEGIHGLVDQRSHSWY